MGAIHSQKESVKSDDLASSIKKLLNPRLFCGSFKLQGKATSNLIQHRKDRDFVKMKYGYCRVSTSKQSIERQIRTIKEQYPDAVIITDKYTGKRMDRPGWQKLYKKIKPGDTIIFDEVSRMSRDATEGFEVYQKLFDMGVTLIFIKEPHISTSVYRKALETGVPMTGTNVDSILKGVNEFLMSLAKEQIQIAFNQAQNELEFNHQRTREGIAVARLNGKQIGQKPGARLTTKKSLRAKEIIQKHSRDFGGSLSDEEVRKLIGCARGSYYKYKRELKAVDSVTDEDSGEKKIEVELERLPSEDTVIKSGVLVDYNFEG